MTFFSRGLRLYPWHRLEHICQICDCRSVPPRDEVDNRDSMTWVCSCVVICYLDIPLTKTSPIYTSIILRALPNEL